MRASLFLLLTFISIVYGIDGYNQWCGKNYEAGSPAIAPSGAFIEPPAGSFDLRCTPTIQPYLSTDDLSSASLMLDYSDRSAKIEVVNPSTQRSILKNGPAISGKVLFKLADLGPPRIEPYVLECRVSNPIKCLTTQFTVSFLHPNPTVSGSVVRKNAESGMLEVPGAEGSLRPFFPFGLR
ncbi:hypothetical protein CROQUDRAFT_417887 [Cronartium quercuum f. sp. fusiforme G11]|uniref:Uncharacterized protein n=1 Tax=Cronartium quercuum f. sp. fusiforme G11 TaxID=708437 RepID=A0A9P6NJV1_9BASI|nr:hypothetical protein CROQUDRAFT_417887 [Cronartium quercuum f. sp. fusiforme G11]